MYAASVQRYSTFSQLQPLSRQRRASEPSCRQPTARRHDYAAAAR